MFDLEVIKSMPFERGDYKERMRKVAELHEAKAARQLFSDLVSTDSVLGVMDAHFWCVDFDGACQDPYVVPPALEAIWGPYDDYFDPPIQIVRLAWNQTPDWVSTMPRAHYDVLKQHVHDARRYAHETTADTASMNQKLRDLLAKACNVHNQKNQSNCLSIAALQHALHGWPVLVGSLGFDGTTDGVTTRRWEHGNGQEEAPNRFR